MVGLAGGKISIRDLETVVELLEHEPWYVTERVEAGPYILAQLAHHESSISILTDGGLACMIHGKTIDEAGFEVPLNEVLDRIFDDTLAFLAELDGPFVIAAADAENDRIILATDKLGSVPCYFTDIDGFAFATEAKGVVSTVVDPTPDVSAMADMLATEFVWGTKTLVEEVRAVPPASFIDFSRGEVEITRYWSFDFERGGEGYVWNLVDSYRDAVGKIIGDSTSDVAMMLSGGLDSRALAACLDDMDREFRTFTYDANPAGGENIRSAGRAADRLGIHNELVNFTPDGFVDVLRRGISLADGLSPWIHYHNLPFVLKNLHDRTQVLVNISGQGEFFGEDILLHRVVGPKAFRDRIYETTIPNTRSKSSLGGLVQQFVHLEQEGIDEVLTMDSSIKSSILDELKKSASEFESREYRILDTVYRNFYPNFHFKSNNIARSQVHVRSAFASEALLDTIAGMPHPFRRRLPHVTSRLKLDIIREIGRGMEDIPYERTGVMPKRPLSLHTASYIGSSLFSNVAGTHGSRPLIFPSEVMQKLLSSGSYSMYGTWYRDHAGLNALVGGLLEDACDRPFFNAETLRTLDRQHIQGNKDNIGVISVITTIESWLREFVDQ